MFFKSLIFVLCLKVALSLYNGAPSEACLTLVPTHGSVFNAPLPVEILLQSNNVRAGYPITVGIRSLPDTMFGDFMYRGFIIQARNVDQSLSIPNRVVGTFDVATGTRHVVCPTLLAQSTLTHSINTDRSFTQVIWRAPHNFNQEFIIVDICGAIVMNVGMYWPFCSGTVRVENPNFVRNNATLNL